MNEPFRSGLSGRVSEMVALIREIKTVNDTDGRAYVNRISLVVSRIGNIARAFQFHPIEEGTPGPNFGKAAARAGRQLRPLRGDIEALGDANNKVPPGAQHVAVLGCVVEQTGRALVERIGPLLEEAVLGAAEYLMTEPEVLVATGETDRLRQVAAASAQAVNSLFGAMVVSLSPPEAPGPTL